MIFNSTELMTAIIKDPTLIKCVAIARIIPNEEIAMMRVYGNMGARIDAEKDWLAQSILKGLVENNLIQFKEEKTKDGVKIDCCVFAIDPTANEKGDNQ